MGGKANIHERMSGTMKLNLVTRYHLTRACLHPRGVEFRLVVVMRQSVRFYQYKILRRGSPFEVVSGRGFFAYAYYSFNWIIFYLLVIWFRSRRLILIDQVILQVQATIKVFLVCPMTPMLFEKKKKAQPFRLRKFGAVETCQKRSLAIIYKHNPGVGPKSSKRWW